MAPMSSDFNGTVADNQHYLTGAMKGPLLYRVQVTFARGFCITCKHGPANILLTQQ